MRRVVVQYKVKKNRVAEHQKLIRAVFRELAKKAPKGFRYCVLKAADGVSFTHIAYMSGRTNPLDSIDAFEAFTERIGERCVELPDVVPVKELAAYRF